MNNNIRTKEFILYYDKDKQHMDILPYENLVKTIKSMFCIVIKKCNIDNELRPDSYIKIDTPLKQTLFSQYLEKNPKIKEVDIDTELFEKIEILFIETLRILDIDNKLTEKEKFVPKKYNNLKMTMTEQLLEKELIEPNLWNRLDDYCHLSMEKYPYDKPNFEYASTWFNYQQHFIDEFIKNIMFVFGDGLGLPQELNPIIPHLTDRRMKSIDFINFFEKNK